MSVFASVSVCGCACVRACTRVCPCSHACDVPLHTADLKADQHQTLHASNPQRGALGAAITGVEQLYTSALISYTWPTGGHMAL